jgi:di/tricarboxylate transporter
LAQSEAFAIVGVMLALFASDRIRYDLVGGICLIAAAVTGIVPAGKVFSGFSNPVIIIIASVLVVSRAIAVSGVVEAAVRRLLAVAPNVSLQIGILTGCVAGLSAFMKNVGTLGIFMPIAIQAAERSKRPASIYLMPLSFGSLVGGTATLIGTSPNLLISTVRQEIGGKPFHMFDFAPVGVPLTVVSVAFLAFAWRLLPKDRRGQRMADKLFEIEDYTSEATLPDSSPLVGRTVGDLEALGDGAMSVIAILRGGQRLLPSRHWQLFAGDVLVIQADPIVLKPVIDAGQLQLHGAGQVEATNSKGDAVETVEAIVTAESLMVGSTADSLHLRQRFEISVLAIGRGGRRITTRLLRTRFQAGDVVVIQGRREALPDTLAELGCLPLADRNLSLGHNRPRLLPVVILMGAIALMVTRLVTPEVAFFGAAVLTVLFRLLSTKEAYDAIDWPVVVMLGCLMPVGEALRDTGATALIADGLTRVAGHVSGELAIGIVLVASMMVTPFLHHAAAVLVMGPVAAVVAARLGYRPDPFLMAVAVGASCDFLTPIGHQNNALVMGPGGYRFGDYWRLGLPLSCLVAVIGTVLIEQAWPLH